MSPSSLCQESSPFIGSLMRTGLLLCCHQWLLSKWFSYSAVTLVYALSSSPPCPPHLVNRVVLVCTSRAWATSLDLMIISAGLSYVTSSVNISYDLWHARSLTWILFGKTVVYDPGSSWKLISRFAIFKWINQGNSTFFHIYTVALWSFKIQILRLRIGDPWLWKYILHSILAHNSFLP